MPSLRELQGELAEAVFSGEAPSDLLMWCAGSHPRRGLEAYRRSVLANLSAAVRMTYPVVGAIVGEAFLDAAARRYALNHPSASGDLNAYGGDFGDFLASFPPASSLPYLPDVARLEWLVHVVYGREDVPSQDLARLAETAPAQWGELHFQLDPAHAVMASPWPVVRIWEVNQPGYVGDFQVDFDEAQIALIHRRQAGTVVERLARGEHRLLKALANGARLGAAIDEAACEEGFDLKASLQRFIGCGLIRGVT